MPVPAPLPGSDRATGALPSVTLGVISPARGAVMIPVPPAKSGGKTPRTLTILR